MLFPQARRQCLTSVNSVPGAVVESVILIHERSDEEDAAAGAAQQVFRARGREGYPGPLPLP